MFKDMRLSRIWMPTLAILTVLIAVLTFNLSPVVARLSDRPDFEWLPDQQAASLDDLTEPGADGSSQPAPDRAIGCSQADLIAAINAANTNPDHSFIELPAGCTFQVSTIDNVDPVFRYNGFPLITSKITINGNGAKITGAKPDIRPFQVASGGELTLNAVEMYGLTHSEQASSIVNQGILHVNYSAFYSNQGRRAGVINNVGEATISNSTFANNLACCCLDLADGGAIYNSGTLTLINSTLADNRANAKGETLYNEGGTILLKNTIITTKHSGDNCAGDPVTDGGGNLRWPSKDTSCVGAIADPKLASLADYGGLTKSMALLPGSAAIDAAVDAICAEAPVENTSQNGVTRPHGPHCDIGAFELGYLVVTSITRLDPNPTNAESVRFAVTFSRPVFGVDPSDFALTTTGIEDAALLSVTGSGSEYTVSVDTGTGSGTLRLDVIDDDSIHDGYGDTLGMEGIENGNFTAGEVYTVDKDPPLVESITRVNANPTQASYVAFLVTFTEPVSGVDASDFTLIVQGLTDAIILSILTETEQSYTVNISTGVGSGTLQLDLIDDDSISDAAGNPLGGEGLENGDFTTGDIYNIDRIPPQVTAITRLDENPNHRQQVDFQVTFSEAVTGVDTSDFSLHTDHLTYIEITEVAGSEGVYIVTVNTGVGDGILRLDLIDDDSIQDLALNPLGGPGLTNGDFTAGDAYTIIDTPIFADVPTDHWAILWIERLYDAGITKGCQSDPLSYCPEQAVTRGEMAVFLLRGIYGGDHLPTLGTGTVFVDVVFDHPFVNWIEQLYDEGITIGCQQLDDKLYFCPADPVSRAEMAIFLLRAKYGGAYQPPALTDGSGFSDVPADHFAAAWIKQLAEDGITTGCGGGQFCPNQSVTRAEMAVFLVRTFLMP